MSVYAVSDLHGMYDLWRQVKEYVKPEDTLYVLGDCADRGPRGWEIIKEVIDMPNAVYLRGNHEKMAIDYDISLWHYNGGQATIFAMDSDRKEEVDRVLDWLAVNTSYKEVYKNTNNQIIYLSHAGFNPDAVPIWNDDYLWDRYHLFTEWGGADDEYIIHGHTPVQYMEEFTHGKNMKDTNAFWYAEGHKICIDQGSFMSNQTILFNLDTFEEIVFKEED